MKKGIYDNPPISKEKKHLADATITLDCNNDCIFCPRQLLSLIACGNDKSSIFKALEKIRKRTDIITLTGGEVTIIPELFEIIAKCHELNFHRISIITNGRMAAYDKFAEKLKAAGISSMGVSLYSINDKVHDNITRVKGSCSQTKLGIKNLLKRSMNLWVNITVSSYNQSTLHKTISELASMGVEDVLIISVITEDKRSKYDLTMIKKQFKRIADNKIPNLRITLRGFDKKLTGILIEGNINGEKIAEENHGFDTLVSINDNYKKYLTKATFLAKERKN